MGLCPTQNEDNSVSLTKSPLVIYKYPIFEWASGIPILDKIQEEAPDITNEDELDFEDFAINDDDNEQEKD